MSRKMTFGQMVQRADHKHQREATFPVEYEFSNGRIFRGVSKNRSVYGTNYLLDHNGDILLDHNGDALLGSS